MQLEETRGANNIDAPLAAVANDLYRGVASGIYRARSARKDNSVGEDLLEPSLDYCRKQVGRSLNESHDALLGEFYRGMDLLTKSEEKRFSKEKEVLELESNEDEESEEEKARAKEITQAATRGPVRVEVVTAEEESERRPVKRQKIVL